MSVRETANSVQEQVLDALKSGEEAVLSAVRTAVETAEPVTSLIPAPVYAERLPLVTEVVESAFTFAEKVLANQKKFVTELLSTVAPEQKPAAKPVPKATTKAA